MSGMLITYGEPLYVSCPKDGICTLEFDSLDPWRSDYGWVRIKTRGKETIVEYQMGPTKSKFKFTKIQG